MPVNTNYRYTADELVYLWDNADAGAVVFHGTFAVHHRADQGPVARRCGRGCGWTTARATAPTGPTRTRRRPRAEHPGGTPPWGRSGDDLLLLYTGGTTGMPKGVMWRQDDLFRRARRARWQARSHEDGTAADLRGDRTRRPVRASSRRCR